MNKKKRNIFWRKMLRFIRGKISNDVEMIDLTEKDTYEQDTDRYEISPRERAQILLREDPELYRAVLDHYDELIWNRMKKATVLEEKILQREGDVWLRKVAAPTNIRNFNSEYTKKESS